MKYLILVTTVKTCFSNNLSLYKKSI